MKYYFLLFTLMMTAFVSNAQDCSSYYYMQNGKTIEMTIYGKNDKVTGVQTYTVSDVKNNSGTVSATINSKMVSDKGKELSASVIHATCSGNNLNMDMTMFIPAAQQQQLKNVDASANAVYIQYPASMNIGDQLPDGNFSMDMQNDGGMKMSLSIQISNRKVEAKESVTTSAGTWECYKITSSQRITTKISGIGIPINMDVTEWFAPGFGIVKTETKYGKTEITSVK